LFSCNWSAVNNQNKIDAFLSSSLIIDPEYNDDQDNHNKKINEIKNMRLKNECSYLGGAVLLYW